MVYGIRERAVLIALAALGGECSNTELKNVYRLDLLKKFRDRLNKDGLVTSAKENRSFTHALTERGWAHVAGEMEAEVPPRSGSAAGALFALLAGLKPAADRAGGLQALLAARLEPVPAQTIEATTKDQIQSAYRALAKRPQDWVMLRDLRERLKSAAKSDVDSTLKRMLMDQEIDLTLIEDRASITDADRTAAIKVGANDMHLMRME